MVCVIYCHFHFQFFFSSLRRSFLVFSSYSAVVGYCKINYLKMLLLFVYDYNIWCVYVYVYSYPTRSCSFRFQQLSLAHVGTISLILPFQSSGRSPTGSFLPAKLCLLFNSFCAIFEHLLNGWLFHSRSHIFFIYSICLWLINLCFSLIRSWGLFLCCQD